jgi:hypothetical protein
MKINYAETSKKGLCPKRNNSLKAHAKLSAFAEAATTKPRSTTAIRPTGRRCSSIHQLIKWRMRHLSPGCV